MAKASIHVMFKLESDVNDYVKAKLTELGLKKLIDFNEESGMSDYMKEALKGSAKTKDKTSFGKPDFHIEKYRIPIVIEDIDFLWIEQFVKTQKRILLDRIVGIYQKEL